MSKKNLLKAEYADSMMIGTIEVGCAVLPDGTALITQREFLKAIGRQPGKRGDVGLPPFLAPKALKAFVDAHLTVPTDPVEFIMPQGGIAYGYNALLLAETCTIYLAAERAGALTVQQQHIADRCFLLQSSFSAAGIVAAIYEATGYESPEGAYPYRRIVNRYLMTDARAWEKTYPDEFWIKLLTIKGRPLSIADERHKHPYIGHWLNEIVYKRLAPGIYERLQEINPTSEAGFRNKKHHQHMTAEARKRLFQYLGVVMYLMDTSDNEEDFMEKLDASHPKAGDNFLLDF